LEIIIRRRDNVAEKIVNGKHVNVPIEKFTTAPLGTIRNEEPISKVPHPDEVDMRDAKDWVDANQK
jgi:hypothetical protein